MRILAFLLVAFVSRYLILLFAIPGFMKLKWRPIIIFFALSGCIITIILGELKTAFFWSLFFLTAQYNINRIRRLQSTIITPQISYIIITISILLVIFMKNGHLIIGIDKNIFTVVYAFLLLYITYYRKVTIIEMLLYLLFAFFVASTNMLFYILIIFSLQTMKIKIKSAPLTALFTANILALGYVWIAGSFYDLNDPHFFLFPASVIERGLAFLTYIQHLVENGVPFLRGNFNDYSQFAITYVHNDLLKLVVQHGLLYAVMITALQIHYIRQLQISFESVFAIYLFSGMLGGMGWFGGHMIMLFFIFLNTFERRSHGSI